MSHEQGERDAPEFVGPLGKSRDVNSALVVLWGALLMAGPVLVVVGVRLRRKDRVRTGVPGNAVVLVGIALIVGRSAGLRRELAK